MLPRPREYATKCAFYGAQNTERRASMR